MKMLRLRGVCNKTDTSPADVWRRVKDDPRFPKPVKLSPKITVWVEAEIDEYLEAKVAESRGKRAAA